MPDIRIKNLKIEACIFVLVFLFWLGVAYATYLHIAPVFFVSTTVLVYRVLSVALSAFFDAVFISLSFYLLRNERWSKFQPGHFLLLLCAVEPMIWAVICVLIFVVDDPMKPICFFAGLGNLLTYLIAIMAILRLKKLLWWQLFFVTNIVIIITATVDFLTSMAPAFSMPVTHTTLLFYVAAYTISIILFCMVTLIMAIYKDVRDLSRRYDSLHWAGVICGFAWFVIKLIKTIPNI